MLRALRGHVRRVLAETSARNTTIFCLICEYSILERVIRVHFVCSISRVEHEDLVVETDRQRPLQRDCCHHLAWLMFIKLSHQTYHKKWWSTWSSFVNVVNSGYSVSERSRMLVTKNREDLSILLYVEGGISCYGIGKKFSYGNCVIKSSQRFKKI